MTGFYPFPNWEMIHTNSFPNWEMTHTNSFPNWEMTNPQLGNDQSPIGKWIHFPIVSENH